MEMLSNAVELIALFAMAAWLATPSLEGARLNARARREKEARRADPDRLCDPFEAER